jgi:hypothetical protein
MRPVVAAACAGMLHCLPNHSSLRWRPYFKSCTIGAMTRGTARQQQSVKYKRTSASRNSCGWRNSHPITGPSSLRSASVGGPGRPALQDGQSGRRHSTPPTRCPRSQFQLATTESAIVLVGIGGIPTAAHSRQRTFSRIGRRSLIKNRLFPNQCWALAVAR